MTVWLPKRSWTRAAPNVSKKLQIAKSKKKRVVSRAKALDLQAEYNAFRTAAVKRQVANSKKRVAARAGSLQAAAEKLLGRKPKGKA